MHSQLGFRYQKHDFIVTTVVAGEEPTNSTPTAHPRTGINPANVTDTVVDLT